MFRLCVGMKSIGEGVATNEEREGEKGFLDG